MAFILVADTIAPTAPIPTPAPIFVAPNSAQIGLFFSTLGLSVIGFGLLYVALFSGLRLLFRRLEQEFPLIALNVSQIPLALLFILISLKLAIASFGTVGIVDWLGRAIAALSILVASVWIAQLFTQGISYYLRKYAQKTEAMWDDVLVPLVESTFPILIYLIGGFLFLESLGLSLAGLWVAFGGATFVLGFALKDILANFFSGLVLLIDTPFQFGDVIQLPDGSTAIIKKIGIRLTNLFLVDTNCELFVPNGTLEGQNIINLSRPSPNYSYSLTIPLRADTEPAKAMAIMREVVQAHPDTLGDIDEKLRVIDQYYEVTDRMAKHSEYQQAKKETGLERLSAEKQVNDLLTEIHQTLKDMIEKVRALEKSGFENTEVREIQSYFLTVLKLMGLEMVAERQGKRRLSWFEESQDQNTLIQSVRTWYRAFAADPDLTKEDDVILAEEWEKKIELLKLKINKFSQRISRTSVDERKLDDYLTELMTWLDERFKNTKIVWHDPKIWTTQVKENNTIATMDYVVKFYIDNIKLEQCQRGNRIKSEVQRELTWQLRQAYIYR